MTARGIWVGVGLAALVAVTSGVAAGADWMFDIRAAEALHPSAVDVGDDAALLNLVARSIVDTLKLQLPDRVPYAAYGSESAFVEALIAQGRPAERARDLGRSTI